MPIDDANPKTNVTSKNPIETTNSNTNEKPPIVQETFVTNPKNLFPHSDAVFVVSF